MLALVFQDGGGRVIDKYINCKECGALIFPNQSVKGIGVVCGCLKKYVCGLEKEIECLRAVRVQQPVLWDNECR